MGKDIILNFSSITHNGDELDSKKAKFRNYLSLFSYSHLMTDDDIIDRFYALSKAILQYCTNKLLAVSKDFDYELFGKNQADLILKCLLSDELTLKYCTNISEDGIVASDCVEHKDIYQIIPHTSDFHIKWIMWALQYEIAKKWHRYNIDILGDFSDERKDFMEEVKNHLSNSCCQG